MKIFDKRPLSLILCILLGAFVLFSYGDKALRISLISIAALLILISIFVKNIEKSQKLTLVLASLLILFSSFASFLYFDVWYYADKRFSDLVTVEGVVENVNFDTPSKNMTVLTDSINEKALSDYKIIVKINDSDITNLTPGAKIKFNAKLDGFEKTSDFDSASYYYSRGFSAEATDITNIEVIGYKKISVLNEITKYRHSLARKLVMYSDKSSGGLLAALLLGERSFLDGEIKLDFSRIGITHILALSGMHVAILCYGFSRLLSVFHVNKKIRKLSEILFAIGYMVLTGFPVSVVRAGLMLIISSALFLLSSAKDAVTNLFVSVMIIVLIAPYSIFDLSLWLSAFATLGIIAFSEINEKQKNAKCGFIKRSLVAVSAPFLTSFFAISATLLLSFVSFGSLSLLSIISTAVFSPIFLLLMYVGVFFLLTASFIPIGNLITAYCTFISSLSSRLSSFKYSLLSTDFILTEFLIVISTLFFFLFLILNIKRKSVAIILSIFLFLSTFFSAWGFTAFQLNKFEFEYNETEERERILIKNDSDVSLIEFSKVTDSVIYETVDYLESNSILYLDNYFITDYSNESYAALDAMLSLVKIEAIYLPTPKTESMNVRYNYILDVLNEYSINVITYQEEDCFFFSDFTVFPLYYNEKGKCALTIRYRNEFYTYITADMLVGTTKPLALKAMNGATTVIVGAKNASSGSPDFIYKLNESTNLIYNKKTGLSDEILTYYENRITIDPNGSIDLYVE